jgi:hypothetical protein
MTDLYRPNICVLRNVLELVKTFFGHLALSQTDAKLDKSEHDGFEGLKTGAFRAL